MPLFPSRAIRATLVLMMIIGMIVTPRASILAAMSTTAGQPSVTQTALRSPDDLSIVAANRSKISAGNDHACQLLENGTAHCWGRNYNGQLGDGTTINRSTPVVVGGATPLTNIIAISAGSNHTCALLGDGTARCWGWNDFGQLGNGSIFGSPTPVVVGGSTPLTGIVTLATGAYHSCAVLADGTARCWGRNSYGQLGNSDQVSGPRPTPVTVGYPNPLTNIIAISASSTGGEHTCVVLADRTARCWGWNEYGQLGYGSDENSATPVVVGGSNTPLMGVLDIRASWRYTCALMVDGTARCWGMNSEGALGNGTGINSLLPVVVGGSTPLTQISSIRTGASHACALLANGTARCWGWNENGRLGDGTTNQQFAPVVVGGDTPLTLIAGLGIGSTFSCGVLANNSVRCWGYNIHGQLGDGTTTDSALPVAVLQTGAKGNHATQLSTHTAHSCALISKGTVHCWGENSFGQLGDGTTTSSTTPVTVTGLTDVVSVSTGELHSCAVLADGTARCWGENSDGQLGDGTTTASTTPVAVSGLSDVVAINAGGFHTCAVLGDGTGRCWGDNGTGQLGNGSTTDSATPVGLIGLSTLVSLNAGTNHTCAVRSDSSLRCWGDNFYGQLGNGTSTSSTTPVAAIGIGAVAAVNAGAFMTCVMLINGTVRCWGENSDGQLGNGTMIGSTTPVTVTGLTGVVDIGNHGNHTCAALNNGTVRCWGDNSAGQLGNGTTTDSTTPVTVSGLTNIVDVGTGVDHSCALRSNGTVYCWGGASTTPVIVPLDVLVSISGGSVAEGHSGTTSLTFSVTLSEASANPITVAYATANGTASAPSDYTAATGMLTFAPDESTKTITVTVNGDTTYEANETLSVTLSNADGALIATDNATGTIINDDSAPTLTISGGGVAEGNSGTRNLIFTTTLSAQSSLPISVTFASANGSASASSDYTAISGTLVFASGQTTRTIAVAVNGDTLHEANETLSVTLSNPTNASIATASATGTITNDDGPPALSISGGGSVAEGHSGTTNLVFTATLSAQSGLPVSVGFATSNGTASAPSDYTAISGMLTFAPGESTKLITVTVNGDTLYETDETLSVTLSNPNGATIDLATATGTITNDDGQPALSIVGGSVLEGASGTSSLVFTVTLGAASGLTTTVSFASANGTATSGSDYTAQSGALTFAPGQTIKTISVQILGDEEVEPDETLSVTLSNAVGATLGTASATGTILSDDEETGGELFMPIIQQ